MTFDTDNFDVHSLPAEPDYSYDEYEIPLIEQETTDEQGRRVVPIQWARRLFHMSSAIIPLAVLASGLTTQQVLTYTWPLVLLFVVPEFIRLRWPAFNRLFIRLFGALLRPGEKTSFHNGAQFAIVVYGGVALFGIDITAAAFMCLSFGDPMAAIIGLKWGRTPVLGKSLEGSLACFAVSMVVCTIMFPHNLVAAGLGALGATLGELVPIKGLNDNFRIPLAASAMILLGTMLV